MKPLSLPPTPTRFTRIHTCSDDDDCGHRASSSSVPPSPERRWPFGSSSSPPASATDDAAVAPYPPPPPVETLPALDLNSVAPLSPGVINELTSPRAEGADLIDRMFALNCSARELGLQPAPPPPVLLPSEGDEDNHLDPHPASTTNASPESLSV